MTKETLIVMTIIGVSSAVGEKVLDSLGKTNLANYLSVASVAGLGTTAIGVVANLINTLRGF